MERETHELVVRLRRLADAKEREKVYERLAEIGPEAREALPWLIAHFDDSKPTYFERDEQFVLVALGPEAAPVLATELRAARTTEPFAM